MKSSVTGDAQLMKRILSDKPQYRECLFSRGYFITNNRNINGTEYPFYGLWNELSINNFRAFIHKDQDYYFFDDDKTKLLLVGHAYNPFNGVYDENILLQQALSAYTKSYKDLFNCISEWTGIHALYIFKSDEILSVQDCAGVKAVYYGCVNGDICYTSHPQLVADIYDLKMDKFVKKLAANRFYNIGNRYLPGDYSPYSELKRIGANVYLKYDTSSGFSVHRFYPTSPHPEFSTKEEYDTAINQAKDILHKNLELVTKKWPRAAISLSGGTDSKTTLASSNGLYDKFTYFSFQSKDTEVTDSLVAHEICEKIGVKHDIYPIPSNNEEIEDYKELKAIIEHSYGYVRGLAEHEVRKHIFLYKANLCDTEVKSWSSEIVRVFFERKYGISFPKRLSARHFSIFQTRYFLSPMLLRKSDKIYKDFMQKFDIAEPKYNFEHTDMYYWEVRMSSWGMMVSQSLDICHRATFPFNNRKLIELMLSIPREYRKNDKAHNDIIKLSNLDIYDMHLHVNNNYFNKNRILLEKVYYLYRTFLHR